MRNELLLALIGGAMILEGCAPATANPPGREKPVEGPTPTLTAPGEYISDGNASESYNLYHARGTNRFTITSNYISGVVKAEKDIENLESCGKIKDRKPITYYAETIETEKSC